MCMSKKKVMSLQLSAYIPSSVNCLKIIPSFWKKILGIYRRFQNIDLKNHTHVRKVRHTSELPFGTYWWTLKNPKNQTFEKMNKNCWRYHFTHVHQKPQSHEVQFLRNEMRLNFLSFWASFWPFNPLPLTTQKTKKTIIFLSYWATSFYTCVPSIMIRWCMVSEILYATDRQIDGQTDGKSDI